jgi:hypothetical protein
MSRSTQQIYNILLFLTFVLIQTIISAGRLRSQVWPSPAQTNVLLEKTLLHGCTARNCRAYPHREWTNTTCKKDRRLGTVHTEARTPFSPTLAAAANFPALRRPLWLACATAPLPPFRGRGPPEAGRWVFFSAVLAFPLLSSALKFPERVYLVAGQRLPSAWRLDVPRSFAASLCLVRPGVGRLVREPGWREEAASRPRFRRLGIAYGLGIVGRKDSFMSIWAQMLKIEVLPSRR